MPDRSRRKRAGSARVFGRRRASYLADRLGTALRTARKRLGLTQAQVGERAGLSQTFVSQAERQQGQDASIETWAALAAAVGHQLAAFIELAAVQPSAAVSISASDIFELLIEC